MSASQRCPVQPSPHWHWNSAGQHHSQHESHTASIDFRPTFLDERRAGQMSLIRVRVNAILHAQTSCLPFVSKRGQACSGYLESG